VTTNTDLTTKEASYSGCGCAGGEVVTLTDAVGRRQEIYSDILGRAAKSEVLNPTSSVYSTATHTYNFLLLPLLPVSVAKPSPMTDT
jgi:hypothetical protein